MLCFKLCNSSNPFKSLPSFYFSKKNVVVTKLGLITRVPLYITMNLAVLIYYTQSTAVTMKTQLL